MYKNVLKLLLMHFLLFLTYTRIYPFHCCYKFDSVFNFFLFLKLKLCETVYIYIYKYLETVKAAGNNGGTVELLKYDMQVEENGKSLQILTQDV